MRTSTALTALLAIAALSCAQAQSDEVTVYPDAGGRVLIDPGTGQPRYVPALLDPSTAPGPIRLNMPREHARRHAETSTPAATGAMAETSPAPPVRKHRVARSEPPARQPVPQAAPHASYGASNLSDLADLATSAPAKPKPAPVAAPPAPKLARAEPPPARTKAPEGTAKDSILFAENASDPTDAAISKVHALAKSLNASLTDADTRVELLAYGGPRGEKSSSTRRLSLKRAVIIRQILIDDGIPSERIDVRAMGGVDDNGPTDRVDIFLKS